MEVTSETTADQIFDFLNENVYYDSYDRYSSSVSISFVDVEGKINIFHGDYRYDGRYLVLEHFIVEEHKEVEFDILGEDYVTCTRHFSPEEMKAFVEKIQKEHVIDKIEKNRGF